jgi:hypothetical protein
MIIHLFPEEYRPPVSPGYYFDEREKYSAPGNQFY